MSNVKTGADALNELNVSDGDMKFTSLKSGTTLTVKVLGTADLISFYSYNIFKQVDSFVAENPSKKSKKGYPVENLTPWDKAWKYHKDLSEDFNDKDGQEAGKYRPKKRFAFGFLDLDAGEPIVIDLSHKQGQAVHKAITKYEGKGKLDKLAFELTKEGEKTNTVVSLTPVVDMEDDLSDAQRKNFDNAPDQFGAELFDGLVYEADEEEQIDLLVKAGFDVSLIGLKQTPKDEDGEGDKGNGNTDESGEPIDIDDDDLPF